MSARLCAVILTHSSAPLYEHLVTVPYIVTTDNRMAARHSMWGAKYIDVAPFDNTEMAIGRHVQLAMKEAFATFPECNVLSVLEDDVEILEDYFLLVKTVAPRLLLATDKCFTCINDRGFDHQGPWDPHALQPVTHSIGLGFAMSRRTFWSIKWGIRNWDNFLRATAGLTCFMPEISRCRHHARRGSTHGQAGEAARIARLPRIMAPVSWAYIVPPPSDDAMTYPPCSCSKLDCPEPYRGTYDGLVSRALGAPCRAAPPLSRPSDLLFYWEASERQQSCASACRARGMKCSPAGLRQPASEFLSHFRSCDYYGADMGEELPSTVTLFGVEICNVPVIAEKISCYTSHPLTNRLCPCFRPSRFSTHLFL